VTDRHDEKSPRVARVRGSGVVEIVDTEDGYEFRSYRDREDALAAGVGEADAQALFDPNPEGCDWDCKIEPSGGFVWTCSPTTCTGECHVFIRAPGGEWEDKGPRWHEKELWRGWHRCGCVGARARASTMEAVRTQSARVSRQD
jgi:hypothetical protein